MSDIQISGVGDVQGLLPELMIREINDLASRQEASAVVWKARPKLKAVIVIASCSIVMEAVRDMNYPGYRLNPVQSGMGAGGQSSVHVEISEVSSATPIEPTVTLGILS